MSNPNHSPSSSADKSGSPLEGFEPAHDSPLSERIQKSLYLARRLQMRASQLQTPQERSQQAELDRMIQSPHDKATLTEITDQAFRSNAPRRAVDQLIHILDVQGIPRFFSAMDRALLRGFQSFGSYLPGVAVPLVKEKMHQETANVILPAEEKLLKAHLCARRDEGVRMNVNILGEALLGEREAERRLAANLAALQTPELEALSVKISTIYSQIRPLARRQAEQILCDRLELLFRAASNARFRRADGTQVPKFVYLDMEEYRDMGITSEVFMRTLDREGLEQVRAGIALQAYLPDSFGVQQQITDWAIARVSCGGSPVTIRIVKGANMEMERVEASQNGWPQAPFKSKRQTDANYKRMVEFGCDPTHLAAVRLGIASHNLFDLSYGIVLASEQHSLHQVQFEMLEGMANHQRRALFEVADNLLLYAPACRQEDFIHAIGYLIRRLDENTGPENFLRHAFRIEVDSPQWQALERDFIECFAMIGTLGNTPRRTQDRNAADPPADVSTDWRTFRSEANTDFTLPANLRFAEEVIEQTRKTVAEGPQLVPMVIDGEEDFDSGTLHESTDPSRPDRVVARSRQAKPADIERALRTALADRDRWRTRSPSVRTEILMAVADQICANRGALLGAALCEAGKTLAESDPEVSEAVDFVRFYALSAAEFYSEPAIDVRPLGTVAVIPPWNFPLAIPCGGVAAALASGNTVILKPASATALPAYLLCQCFWRGGVPRTALQLVPCSGKIAGGHLAGSDLIDAVILTGGTATAEAMLEQNPAMNLLAETGGKNATIVTALADRDMAIAHTLQSAFGHSGQKCSATSLLILEAEIYDDPKFKAQLIDAAASLTVGSAWTLSARVGPLIQSPGPTLARALEELEPGESWALRPRRDAENPQLLSPAIKWGVAAGSATHMTEFFGPLLGVMRADSLEHAIDLVNATGYGLTSGLESLDDREQSYWKKNVRAGNLYINRPTTGAIVLRQPFGGMGKSAFGPGIKAGGPNYVVQLMQIDDAGAAKESLSPSFLPLADLAAFAEQLVTRGRMPAEEFTRLAAALASYEKAHREEFSRDHDHFRLIGQDNIRRYLPADQLVVRLHHQDSDFEILARLAAAIISGAQATLSWPPSFESAILESLTDREFAWLSGINLTAEEDRELADRIESEPISRLRYANWQRVPEMIRKTAAQRGVPIIDRAVIGYGRVELLWYYIEQTLSADYHRYGNLGSRSGEIRSEPL